MTVIFMEHETILALAAEHDTPALFLSLNRVRDNYRRLKAALPGVTLFYAVKANPEKALIEVLHEEGCSFDVCTSGEIDIVKACGVPAERCLYTHPIKKPEEIAHAIDFGIRRFVVDNGSELEKMVPYKDSVELIVRISVQNPASPINLSYKFGVAPEKANALIDAACTAELSVKGLCFHAGSQNEDNLKFIEALEYCREICRTAALRGQKIEIIDIGGGFPISYLKQAARIEAFCQPIAQHLDRYFPNYQIIAEPGRAICADAMFLVAKVIGKACRNQVWWYYIDDGKYNSFSGMVYDHTVYPIKTFGHGERQPSVIAGPTCDSFDVLYENVSLPLLKIGDLLVFDVMGAYTSASASRFNCYNKTKVVIQDRGADK